MARKERKYHYMYNDLIKKSIKVRQDDSEKLILEGWKFGRRMKF